MPELSSYERTSQQKLIIENYAALLYEELIGGKSYLLASVSEDTFKLSLQQHLLGFFNAIEPELDQDPASQTALVGLQCARDHLGEISERFIEMTKSWISGPCNTTNRGTNLSRHQDATNGEQHDAQSAKDRRSSLDIRVEKNPRASSMDQSQHDKPSACFEEAMLSTGVPKDEFSLCRIGSKDHHIVGHPAFSDLMMALNRLAFGPAYTGHQSLHPSGAKDNGGVPERFATIERFKPWFPQCDPNHPRASTWSVRLSKQTTALSIHVVVSAAVLLFNVVVTAIALSKYGWNTGVGVAYEGDCEQSNRYNTGLHLVINILSTVLLSASNYCAQILIAPSRNEIDKAHSQGIWLDIGVQSLRNLTNIRVQRRFVWGVLMSSSIILHLL